MIEVYPKYVNQEKLETNLNKLVSAFLMVAEDLVQEEYGDEKSLESEKHEIKEDSTPYNNLLHKPLLSDVRGNSKRENIKTLKT